MRNRKEAREEIKKRLRPVCEGITKNLIDSGKLATNLHPDIITTRMLDLASMSTVGLWRSDEKADIIGAIEYLEEEDLFSHFLELMKKIEELLPGSVKVRIERWEDPETTGYEYISVEVSLPDEEYNKLEKRESLHRIWEWQQSCWPKHSDEADQIHVIATPTPSQKEMLI